MILSNASDEQKIAHVRKVARTAEQQLLEKYPLLKNQDAIGFSVFTLAIFGILASGWL